MTALLLRPKEPRDSPRAARRTGGSRGDGTLLHGLCLGFAALVVLAAVLAPWLTPHDPNAVDFGSALAGPSPDLLLGGDVSGRDTSPG